MLISVVDRDVRPRELAVAYNAPEKLFDCCITLGHEAIDTRSNAIETAHWIEKRGYRTVRLITTDWHMRRARFELNQALPQGVAIHIDAVRSRPSLGIERKSTRPNSSHSCAARIPSSACTKQKHITKTQTQIST